MQLIKGNECLLDINIKYISSVICDSWVDIKNAYLIMQLFVQHLAVQSHLPPIVVLFISSLFFFQLNTAYIVFECTWIVCDCTIVISTICNSISNSLSWFIMKLLVESLQNRWDHLIFVENILFLKLRYVFMKWLITVL